MPLEIALPDDHERFFSLQDYIECLEEEGYDLSDHDDLIASAKHLKKLGNNKDFLIDRVFAELKKSLQFQETNIYAPEVLLLHTANSYSFERISGSRSTKVELQVPGYRYDVCHDHKFRYPYYRILGPRVSQPCIYL